MSMKARTVLAVVFVELVLAGIWFYLARMGAAHPDRAAPEFQQVVGQTMGTTMGAFLGFGLLLFLIAAKRDRQQ
jgi:hypothetical protein